MNELHIGFKRKVKPVPGCLLIQDDNEGLRKYRPKVFDPLKHSFDPLKGMNERKAQELAEIIYTIYPQGEDTLTVRGGKWDLAPAILKRGVRTLRDVTGGEEVRGVMADLLFNPVVRNCLCGGNREFSLDGDRMIFARLDRREIGEKAALTIGLFVIASFERQLVIPDFGFYGRDAHMALIREERLIAGVNRLSELDKQKALRGGVALMDIEARGVVYRDAVELAENAGLRPDPLRADNDYNKFIEMVMGR
jgi:hypothetical protein